VIAIDAIVLKKGTAAMALIVLHCNKNGHEDSLDKDVVHMGSHYGDVIHVLQSENQAYKFPKAGSEPVIHILAHGGEDHVCDLSIPTFKQWMVNAFQMKQNPKLTQTYFVYSCDVAKGGNSLLSGLADHVAGLKIRNRTFIGTVGENGIVNTKEGRGKVLLKTATGQTQALGLGWKGYQTVWKGKNQKDETVGVDKLSESQVKKIVSDMMNW
jgi:hypothetical protein